jgi:DNA-binding NarL/FixJ family response regulator
MDDARVETTRVETAPAELRVLVVDDHTTFAELLSFALSTEQGLSCVGTASNAAEGIVLVQELRPDIVIMDIEMPRQDGLAACRRIREVAPDTVIAVVTAHREPDWVVRATQAGASAFIPKNGSLTEMLDVLRRARSGSMLIAPSAFALTGAATRQNPAIPRRSRLPGPRHGAEGDRAGAGHQRAHLPRLREVAAVQARRELAAGGGRQGAGARHAR